MNKLLRRIDNEVLTRMLSEMEGKAGDFNSDTVVYSRENVRAIVYAVVKSARGEKDKGLADNRKNPKISLSELRQTVTKFAKEHGGFVIWHSWQQKMKEQGRSIREHQEQWQSLPIQDKELDIYIADSILYDFLAWIKEKKEREQSQEVK